MRRVVDPVDFFRHLQPVKQYVDAHISDPISLNEAAGKAGLSKSYFSRLFHRQTGVRFSEWLVHRRISFATELLLTEDKSITEITFAAGFGSISTFERSFKKLHGVTPRSFQRAQRNKLLSKAINDDNLITNADYSTTPAE